MRLIDADALMELARNNVNRTVDCNDIARFPTIDAVPVVRCRECKHHRNQLDDRFVICRRWRKIMEVDGFCHKGAKMDGGANNV